VNGRERAERGFYNITAQFGYCSKPAAFARVKSFLDLMAKSFEELKTEQQFVLLCRFVVVATQDAAQYIGRAAVTRAKCRQQAFKVHVCFGHVHLRLQFRTHRQI